MPAHWVKCDFVHNAAGEREKLLYDLRGAGTQYRTAYSIPVLDACVLVSPLGFLAISKPRRFSRLISLTNSVFLANIMATS